MIVPKQAPVRPRVSLPEGEGDSLLEDAVRARLDAGQWGIIELSGAAGAGKSTALGHLAYVFGDHPLLALADRPGADESMRLKRRSAFLLVVYASPALDCTTFDARAVRWRLSRWTDDDSIEYLLAVHPERCASVMRRLQADPQRLRLAGLPELWRVVLDHLAADESVPDVRAALQREIVARFPKADICSAAGMWCLLRGEQVENLLAQWKDIDQHACSLLRHAPVQSFLAARYLVERLQSARDLAVLEQPFPGVLLEEAASLISADEAVILRLKQVVASRHRAYHAMAASLLHATEGHWRPVDGRAPLLKGAHLAGAQWPGIRLSRLEITAADLSNSDLTEAQLHYVSARMAHLSGANLHGAQLLDLLASKATLTNADLSHVRAPDANFQGANLQGANLEGALLKCANLTEADLSGCNFQRADLREARLDNAKLANADFSGANLSWACLSGLELRLANFTGAQFAHVAANECDLESMRLPGANFERASLCGALLTGSQMPDACFRHANLSEAGLADIDWERVDLRDADLSDCTFHLGSSRSGLVDSPIASEGSRTGFYTDEYLEQDFKAPEEIRKANLRGADLRGAKIDNVDFYLVDLREALYTDDQEAHFRRCRAILETRV